MYYKTYTKPLTLQDCQTLGLEDVPSCCPKNKRSFPKENSKAPPCSPSCSKLKFPASPGISREKWLHLEVTGDG